MDNKELQKKVWSNLEKSQSKAAKFEDTVAVSFSLISETDENIFVVVENGNLRVEPYRYNDYGCEIEASAETVNKLFSGELSFDKALKDGVAVVRGGDVAKFKALECLVPEKKTAAKASAKPAAKKPAAKAEEKKPAAKAEEKKPAAKAEEKKPAAKAEEKKPATKVEEKKPAAKAEEKKPAAKAEEKKPAAVKPAGKK